MRSIALAVLALAGLAWSKSKDSLDHGTATGARLRYGTAIQVGKGEARTYVVRDQRTGDPVEVGIRDPTYQGASRAQQAQIRARVRDVFARLQRERRARLVEVTFRREVVDDLQGMVVRVEYENLETGGRQALESTING